jgi:hypothetical protein
VSLSDVTHTLVRQQASIHTEYQWRFQYMDNYVQLELFDLRAYTSEQASATDGEEEQIEAVSPCVEYKQLELDLFPQTSYTIPIEVLKLAA